MAYVPGADVISNGLVSVIICTVGRRAGNVCDCAMRYVPLLSLLACALVVCSSSSPAARLPVVNSFHRRRLLATSLAATTGGCLPAPAAAQAGALGPLVEVRDPNTYSALAYAPPPSDSGSSGGPRPKPPLLVVLHGAGVNEAPIRSLADPLGEHAGLAPSLLASGRAPRALADNFAMVAPYASGRRSFYEEPRRKLLDFVAWACSDAGRQAGCPDCDPRRVFLFGFSDGATVGVELATTRRFSAAVVAAYGCARMLK